jgi:hypothetical protein
MAISVEARCWACGRGLDPHGMCEVCDDGDIKLNLFLHEWDRMMDEPSADCPECGAQTLRFHKPNCEVGRKSAERAGKAAAFVEAMRAIQAQCEKKGTGCLAHCTHQESVEAIRAVVEAYAEGLITLPPVPKDTNKTHIRYAPSFASGENKDVGRAGVQRPYTAQTLADFIGWLEPNGKPQDKVYNALTALQFIDEGLLKEADFEGLSTSQARAVVEEARKAQNRREEVGSGTSFYAWLALNGFPKDRYQLLCWNCNVAKGKYGQCPHRRDAERALVA